MRIRRRAPIKASTDLGPSPLSVLGRGAQKIGGQLNQIAEIQKRQDEEDDKQRAYDDHVKFDLSMKEYSKEHAKESYEEDNIKGMAKRVDMYQRGHLNQIVEGKSKAYTNKMRELSRMSRIYTNGSNVNAEQRMILGKRGERMASSLDQSIGQADDSELLFLIGNNTSVLSDTLGVDGGAPLIDVQKNEFVQAQVDAGITEEAASNAFDKELRTKTTNYLNSPGNEEEKLQFLESDEGKAYLGGSWDGTYSGVKNRKEIVDGVDNAVWARHNPDFVADATNATSMAVSGNPEGLAQLREMANAEGVPVTVRDGLLKQVENIENGISKEQQSGHLTARFNSIKLETEDGVWTEQQKLYDEDASHDMHSFVIDQTNKLGEMYMMSGEGKRNGTMTDIQIASVGKDIAQLESNIRGYQDGMFESNNKLVSTDIKKRYDATDSLIASIKSGFAPLPKMSYSERSAVIHALQQQSILDVNNFMQTGDLTDDMTPEQANKQVNEMAVSAFASIVGEDEFNERMGIFNKNRDANTAKENRINDIISSDQSIDKAQADAQLEAMGLSKEERVARLEPVISQEKADFDAISTVDLITKETLTEEERGLLLRKYEEGPASFYGGVLKGYFDKAHETNYLAGGGIGGLIDILSSIKEGSEAHDELIKGTPYTDLNPAGRFVTAPKDSRINEGTRDRYDRVDDAEPDLSLPNVEPSGVITRDGMSPGGIISRPPAITKALSVIGGGESSNNYNGMNQGTATTGKKDSVDFLGKELTGMTIDEVMTHQAKPKGNPERIFAAGNYQVIPTTLKWAIDKMGISKDTPFDQETQDSIGEFLLMNKQKKVRDFVNGNSDDLTEAMIGLHTEWRSFPHPTSGKKGDGEGNVANKSIQESKELLLALRAMKENS